MNVYLILARAALEKTGDRSNYLAVIGFTNSTNEGDVVLLQYVHRSIVKLTKILPILKNNKSTRILSPVDPNVPYVSIVVGATNCNDVPIPNGNVAWGAEITPSDGFPR
jgi:hypothetical protein